MSKEIWAAVDEYFGKHLLTPDKALDEALASSTANGLPAIAVSPLQGKQLLLLAQMQNARNVLEIGTLGGYSTIWLARALPADGHLVTLEFSPKHAEVAQANIARAELSQLVEIRVGPALESLPRLAAEKKGPFDFIFIDADKDNNPGYFEWALKLSRPGTVILVDNVVRDGAVADDENADPSIAGIRRMHEMLAKNPHVAATAIQTVGVKGYDGFTLIRVN
ncbi:MAG: O-methyltransferase [Candidatus Acidiferrum sp.]|jgi:predicted O-methyltransferase YrrM